VVSGIQAQRIRGSKNILEKQHDRSEAAKANGSLS
jgi:hypothetical protein